MSQLLRTIALLLALMAPETAVTTAYSTESSGGVARWTGELPALGVTVACPVAWRGEWLVIDGVGLRRCEDTGRWDWWDSGEICGCLGEHDGAPHVDIFMTHEAAVRWGIQARRVWRIGGGR